MAQRPLIKDGVVVNVVEMDDDTESVSKAEHRRREAIENADYAQRSAAWQKAAEEKRKQIGDAHQQSFIASGIVNALKVQAEVEKQKPKHQRMAESFYQQKIGEAERASVVAAENIAKAQAIKLSDRPKPIRPKRWICPEGHTLGPPGGSKGDLWDGKKYTQPEKVVA